MKIKQEIPIFFSCDDAYVPYLTVAIRSLIDHTSKENDYSIVVLNTGLSIQNQKELKQMATENVKINFEDVSKSMEEINNELKLRLRDYYSIAIYYRLFIPSLFPIYEKAIYLDADMVILDDVAKLESVKKNIDKYRIIKIDNKIVSMAIFSKNDNSYHISEVYTRDEYRGRGYAKKVVNAVKNEILALGMKATLNVDKKNPISNHLYSSLGFKKVFSQGIYTIKR